MRTALMAFAAAILFSAPVLAADANPGKPIKTVQDLSDACKSSDGSMAAFICLVYIKGVEDTAQDIGTAVFDHKTPMEVRIGLLPFAGCNLPNVQKVRLAFVTWSDKNSAKAQDRSSAGVVQTIYQNWPCQPAN
jgi:hypothetical protein